MTLKLELTEPQVVLLGEALSAMPYGRVWQLIAELQRQVSMQINAQHKSDAALGSTNPAK
jgi:hypothetical protein